MCRPDDDRGHGLSGIIWPDVSEYPFDESALARARRETIRAMQTVRFWLLEIAAAATAGILAAVLPPSEVAGIPREAFGAAVSPAGVLPFAVFLFAVNILRAPYLQRDEVRKLLTPGFDVTVRPPFDNWVHLAVRNDGPPSDFEAQVTNVGGSEVGQIVPWPIKWRGWEGERRPVAQGQTQLLDLAEGDLMSDPNAPSWRPGVFWFYSTTARFPVRLGGLKSNDALYEKTLAVAVRVTSLSPPCSITKILCLGFDRSTKPRVQID